MSYSFQDPWAVKHREIGAGVLASVREDHFGAPRVFLVAERVEPRESLEMLLARKVGGHGN